MKHFIIFVTLFCFGYVSSGQFKVIETPEVHKLGTAKRVGKTVASITYTLTEGETTYLLSFADVSDGSYGPFRYIEFKNIDGTLNSLYNLLKLHFSSTNIKNKNYSQGFKLGQKVIASKNVRMGGITAVWLSCDEGMMALNRRQLDDLFGK